jgi:hypothetical protein
MRKFTLRYPENGELVIKRFTPIQIKNLLKEKKVESIIEGKISENMPLYLHNAIGTHNHNIEKQLK